MDENNKAGGNKALIFASAVLIAVLLTLGIYWARASKTAQSAPAAQAEPVAEADKLEPATEAGQPAEAEEVEPAGQPDQAGQPAQAQKETESAQAGQPAQEEQEQDDRGSLSRGGYTLEQVVVMSRHNIRSPMSGKGSALGMITPHQWFEWSSNPSELSLRGGAAETLMGQYFRKWLEAEGLFPENYHPEEGAVRFYANSKQRMIATTEYFKAGLLPTANSQLEYNVTYDEMDPVFKPQLTFVSDEYADDVEAQIEELYGDEMRAMEDNFALLEDVIDIEESQAYKSGDFTGFSTDDRKLVLNLNAEPAMQGSFRTACALSDALVLQYYEEPEETKAAFGHTLTQEQWKEISEIKDLYIDILFATPLLAYNVEHPILQEIRSELTAEGREFSFLCGHDSNISGIVSALGASKYSLPSSIETTAPIGVKIVFGRWRTPDGEEFMSVDLVYASADQLRNFKVMDPGNPPYVVSLTLEGLEQNEDGLYKAEDVLGRLDEAIGEYDKLLEKYAAEPEEEELDEAA